MACPDHLSLSLAFAFLLGSHAYMYTKHVGSVDGKLRFPLACVLGMEECVMIVPRNYLPWPRLNITGYDIYSDPCTSDTAQETSQCCIKGVKKFDETYLDQIRANKGGLKAACRVHCTWIRRYNRLRCTHIGCNFRQLYPGLCQQAPTPNSGGPDVTAAVVSSVVVILVTSAIVVFVMWWWRRKRAATEKEAVRPAARAAFSTAGGIVNASFVQEAEQGGLSRPSTKSQHTTDLNRKSQHHYADTDNGTIIRPTSAAADEAQDENVYTEVDEATDAGEDLPTSGDIRCQAHIVSARSAASPNVKDVAAKCTTSKAATAPEYFVLEDEGSAGSHPSHVSGGQDQYFVLEDEEDEGEAENSNGTPVNASQSNSRSYDTEYSHLDPSDRADNRPSEYTSLVHTPGGVQDPLST